MKLNSSLARVLAPAYAPCQSFTDPCAEMRWNPSQGHVPRGFLGAAGTLEEVELVLVFAEPGDPHENETHKGLISAYEYATFAFETGKDQFHRNVRAPHALVVALGKKAQNRLRSLGFTTFLFAFAVAPPGCNFRPAQESWDRIPIELRRLQNTPPA